MYLTGGQYKGYKIEVPKSARPTLSKVRESIFNMLIQYELTDNTFLDMFAGSAIMGLEALSRGYDVYEIEINPKSAKIIKKNYEKLGKTPKLTVCDALKYVTDMKFSVIYLDPPWNMDYFPIIKKAKSLLNKNGIMIVEYEKALADERRISQELKLKYKKSKKYGRCHIDIYENSTD